MQYNRLWPIIVTVFSFVSMELFYFWPKLFYVTLVFLFLLFFFICWQFVRVSKKEKWWVYAILPSIFTFGLLLFSLLVPSRWLVHILFIFNIIFLYFYFRTIYFYLIKPDLYKEYYLENLSAYGNFLAFYLLSSAVYGLQSFLNLPIWVLLGILLILVSLIVYQMLWAYKINIGQSLLYILIISLIIFELAWSMSFLTLSYYILGLLLSICYYLLISIVKFYLLEQLNNRIIKLYLFYGFFIIFTILLTARWL